MDVSILQLRLLVAASSTAAAPVDVVAVDASAAASVDAYVAVDAAVAHVVLITAAASSPLPFLLFTLILLNAIASDILYS